MILQTERLTLRPLEAGDASAVFRLISDAELLARWDGAEIEDPDVVAAIVEAQVGDVGGGSGVYWAILHDGFIAGLCDLSDIDRKKREAELGFVLGRGAWDQGFGPEAIHAVVGHAAHLGLRRLVAQARVGAERSEAILKELGFKPVSYLRGHIQRGGERRDYRIYALTL